MRPLRFPPRTLRLLDCHLLRLNPGSRRIPQEAVFWDVEKSLRKRSKSILEKKINRSSPEAAFRLLPFIFSQTINGCGCRPA